jgi:SPOR domain
MADRFQDRPLSDDLDRLDPRGRGPVRGGDADPLAELARLIGQNDPFGGGGGPAVGGGMSRANARVQQPQRAAPDQFRAPMPPAPSPVDDPLAAGGPPPWMQRTGRPEAPRLPPVVEPNLDQGEVAHPMQRYGAEPAPPQPQFRDEQGFDDREQEPARYDDALFGQLDTGGPAFQREQPYPDDPYAFQDDGYEEGEEEDDRPKRGNGFAKMVLFLVIGVIGTGAAFAYRTYMGASRSGDPPIIRADNSPTKILTPVPADGISKVPDRLGDQGEKMVSREETPVDVNTRSVSPRVVFPMPNQSGAAPAPASNAAATDAMQMPPVATPDTPAPSGGTMPAGEPRRIKTLSVRGDQADGGTAAAASTAAPPKAMKGRNPPASANASANAPMPISPQSPAPAADKRIAAVNPAPAQDAAADAAPAAEDSGYLVSVSSQKSEADAQASFRALKTKYADAMGSYSAPVIKRVDIPGKGVMYRAMVGPFDTSEAANQFCKSLQSAGGQCFVPKK